MLSNSLECTFNLCHQEWVIRFMLSLISLRLYGSVLKLVKLVFQMWKRRYCPNGRQRDKIPVCQTKQKFPKSDSFYMQLCRSQQKVVVLADLSTVYQYWTQHFSGFFRHERGLFPSFSGMGACGARPAEQKQLKHVHPCLFPMYVVKARQYMRSQKSTGSMGSLNFIN